MSSDSFFVLSFVCLPGFLTTAKLGGRGGVDSLDVFRSNLYKPLVIAS